MEGKHPKNVPCYVSIIIIIIKGKLGLQEKIMWNWRSPGGAAFFWKTRAGPDPGSTQRCQRQDCPSFGHPFSPLQGQAALASLSEDR